MCAKNHLLVFSSFLDTWENVEWPRFFWTTRYVISAHQRYRQTDRRADGRTDAKRRHHRSIAISMER